MPYSSVYYNQNAISTLKEHLQILIGISMTEYEIALNNKFNTSNYSENLLDQIFAFVMDTYKINAKDFNSFAYSICRQDLDMSCYDYLEAFLHANKGKKLKVGSLYSHNGYSGLLTLSQIDHIIDNHRQNLINKSNGKSQYETIHYSLNYNDAPKMSYCGLNKSNYNVSFETNRNYFEKTLPCPKLYDLFPEIKHVPKNYNNDENTQTEINSCGANLIFAISVIENSSLRAINHCIKKHNYKDLENEIENLYSSFEENINFFKQNCKISIKNFSKKEAMKDHIISEDFTFHIADEILLRYRLERYFHRNFNCYIMQNYNYCKSFSKSKPPSYILVGANKISSNRDYKKEILPKLESMVLQYTNLPNIYSVKRCITPFHGSVDLRFLQYDELSKSATNLKNYAYPVLEGLYFYSLYYLFHKENETVLYTFKKIFNYLSETLAKEAESYLIQTAGKTINVDKNTVDFYKLLLKNINSYINLSNDYVYRIPSIHLSALSDRLPRLEIEAAKKVLLSQE